VADDHQRAARDARRRCAPGARPRSHALHVGRRRDPEVDVDLRS
jgi:hypothetical protein